MWQILVAPGLKLINSVRQRFWATFEGQEITKVINVTPVVFGVKPGEPDGRFLPTVAAANGSGAVNDMQLLPDGKILIAGNFDSVNGLRTVRNIARLNSDGTCGRFHFPRVPDLMVR